MGLLSAYNQRFSVERLARRLLCRRLGAGQSEDPQEYRWQETAWQTADLDAIQVLSLSVGLCYCVLLTVLCKVESKTSYSYAHSLTLVLFNPNVGTVHSAVKVLLSVSLNLEF